MTMEAAATPGAAAGLSTLESIATLGVLPEGIPWAAEGGAPCARRSIAERLAEVLAAFAEPQRGAAGGAGAGADGAAAMDEDGGGRAAPPEFTAEQLCARLEGFAAPPFTMQRLCELLLEPRRHYRTLAKFTNACAKLLIVRRRPSPRARRADRPGPPRGAARLAPSRADANPGSACAQVTDLIQLQPEPLAPELQAEVRPAALPRPTPAVSF